MADETLPLPKGFTAVKPTETTIPLPKGFTPVKKKDLSTDVDNTSQPLNIGGQHDLYSQINGNNTPVNYAPITDPELRQQAVQQDYAQRNQAQQRKQEVSNKLTKLRSELDPETTAGFDKAIDLATRQPQDNIRGSKEDQEHYQFMQSPIGKVLGTVAYLGSKATKGTLQVAKGAAHYANMAVNPGSAAAGLNPLDETFQKADEAANYGLTKGDESRMGESKVLSNLGGLAEFAPAAAAATSTAGATLFLQGAGQASEQLEQAQKNNGQTINPLVKEAFIGGTGLVNKFLMHDMAGIFGKLPAGLRADIAAKVSADAIKEASDKELTGEAFNNLLQSGARQWADKVAKTGVKALQGTSKATLDLSGLAGSNFLLRKGVDQTTDQPIFNDNPADLAQSITEIATQTAPAFGLLGAGGDAMKLTPYSSYKNSVVESLMHDPSEANIQKVKQDLVDHNMNQDPSQQWTRDELDATVSQVDKIADVAKKLPRGIPEKKMVDAVDLVNGREELKQQLGELQKQRSQLDESVNQEPNDGEQLLIDKIDQANDKLKDIVSGKKTTYSIEKGEDGKEDKFFKKTDGKIEPIEESRYNLENLERQAKAKPNEQPSESTSIENTIPETQPPNETGVPEAVGEKPVETTQNNIANESNQESVSKGSQETNGEISPESSGKENNVIQEGDVTQSGVEQSAPEITVNEVRDNPITYKGEPAEIIQDGQTLVAKIKGSNREYELGNVDEIGGKSIKELGIEHENSVVGTHENGNIVVRGKEYVNNYSDPKSAINYGKDGNVISVNLETIDGAKRAFKGDVAEDIAYQIHLKELNKDNGTKQQFEQFVEANEPIKSEIISRADEVATEKTANKDNATVSRKPAKPKVIEITPPPIEAKKVKSNETANTGTTEPIAGEIQRSETKSTEAIPTEEAVPKGDKGVPSPTEPIGITKEETRKQREVRGLENLPDAEKTTLSKMFDEGKEAVETKQVDPAKLAISVADKPRNLSPVEVNALLYDRQAIREQSDAIRGQIEDLLVKESKDSNFDNLLNGTSESMQVLQDRQRFLDAALDNNEKALRAGANQNALALVAMQNMINADYTLSEQRSRMRVKAGGELTKAMEAELERYDKELKEAKAQVEEYQKKLNEKLAKDEIKKAQVTARASKKAETKETIQTERKAIVDDFKAHLEKIRKSGTLSSDIPYRRELAAATVYMTRMVGNLAKEGIIEFKDVIDRIHDEFKDAIENLTKEDVRDVLAGIYKERKESKNDLLEQKNAILRIAKLTKQIEDLKNGVKTEKKEGRLIKKRNAIVELENEVKTLKSHARIEDAADLGKESLKRRIEKLNERIKNEDFEKPQGRPRVDLDPEVITLTARLRRSQNNFDAMADRLASHTESNLDKPLSTIQKVRRFMLLSGVKTLGKLYAFAADRSITTPIEELTNALNSKLPFLRKIAQRSPRFAGGFDPKAEAKAITTRISLATIKDSWIEVLKTGVGELDRVYGKHGVDKDFDLNPSALEFFGRLHGALKNSTKRAEFFRSMQKRLQYAAEQGKDINDPNIQFATGLEAYADGKRAILMNDNLLVDKGYKSLLRGLESGDNNQAGKVFAAVIRGLFPIVKIPTNYVVESFDVATLGARAIPKIIQAMVKGADTLSPKEADMVMRTIAKGQIGLALMMYAYANPKMFGGYYSGKRKDDDLKAGDIIIGGYHLPHWMAHNPYFEAMQMAATMRRAIDTANGNGAPEGIMNQLTTSKRNDLASMAVKKSDKNNPDSQLVEVQDGKQLYQVYLKGNKITSIVKEGGIKQGLNTAVKGLAEQIPFTSIGDIMSSTSSPATAAGSVAKNLVEPRFVQEIAEWTDRKDGEAVKRDPQGFVEQMKSGIPGLRKDVTEKAVKQDKKLSTITLTDGTVFQLTKEQIAEREKLNEEYLAKYGDKLRKSLKRKNLTEHDIVNRLKSHANAYSKPLMLRKYRVNGKFTLKQADED